MVAVTVSVVGEQGGGRVGVRHGDRALAAGAGSGFSLTFNTQPATPPAEFLAGAVGASGCKGVGDDGNAEMAAAWRR